MRGIYLKTILSRLPLKGSLVIRVFIWIAIIITKIPRILVVVYPRTLELELVSVLVLI
jgi:hypothetical protein